jgi:hypothetical protein
VNLRFAQNHPTYDLLFKVTKVEVIAKLPKGMFLWMETHPNPSFPRWRESITN